MQDFDTPRLHLRPLGDRDEALYCALYTDPGLMRFIAAPLSMEAAQRSFGVACRQQSPRPQRWIIVERDTADEVGLLGLIGQGDGPELGVMLLPPWHGRGFGPEAMAGMVEHAFTVGGVDMICAHQAVADNPIVIKMMRSLGFAQLPPTDIRPLGGDWELIRARWQQARAALVVAEQAVAGADGSR